MHYWWVLGYIAPITRKVWKGCLFSVLPSSSSSTSRSFFKWGPCKSHTQSRNAFHNLGFKFEAVVWIADTVRVRWLFSFTSKEKQPNLVEGSVLSGSLNSLWPASFGLFACLDFGPCPLCFFFTPLLCLGAFLL